MTAQQSTTREETSKVEDLAVGIQNTVDVLEPVVLILLFFFFLLGLGLLLLGRSLELTQPFALQFTFLRFDGFLDLGQTRDQVSQ